MGIEGCDPLALPLSAMLYATADHQSLRRLSHGRELYIIPTSDIASCIFMTKLNQALKRRGVDLHRASQTYCRDQLQQTLDRTTATQKAAEAIAQTIQKWIPLGTLLVQQTNPNIEAIFQQNPVTKLNQKSYQQWVENLAMDPAKKATVQKHIEKALDWWRQQPDSAYTTLGRVAVGLGIPP